MKHLPESSTDALSPVDGPAGLNTPDSPASTLPGPAPQAHPGYRAPPWLRGGHWQTIWPALLAGGPRVDYRRERWTTPDDDFVDLDWATATAAGEPADGPLVALFHGLEGDSDSPYARALMTRLVADGWRGVVVHWRGCSGEPNRLARAYHSGDSDEVDWILRRLRPDFVAGVSLGANVLLKWLGEQGSQAGFIRAAAGVSAPQDLHAAAVSLQRGFNRRAYCLHLLKTLNQKSVLKLDRFPDLYDRREVIAARDFFDFDNVVTAPLHGFENALDYWTRSSCRQYLGGIGVPTLVLNARNDPFLPEAALARPSEVSRAVVLEYPADGGHVGFPVGFAGSWLPQRLTDFFRLFA